MESKMKITENCIVNGMPDNVYHSDPTPMLEGFVDSASLSASTLSEMLDTTEVECRQNMRRFNPEIDRGDTDAADFGQIAHDFILLGGKSKFEIVPFKDFRTNDAKAVRDDLRSRGIIPLAQSDKTQVMLDNLKTMSMRLKEQITEHRDWQDIMIKGAGEQSAFAFDGKIWNRSRIDWLDETHENLIVDYKTTGLDFKQWDKNELWGGLYIQEYHYKRVLDLINGKDKRPARFIFVVQQIKAPFLIKIFEIDQSFYPSIQTRYNFGYRKFLNCVKTGVWRGQPPYTAYSCPPSWVEQQWENDLLTEEFMAIRDKTVQPIPMQHAAAAG
jgi:hypothetical protein